MYKIYFYDRVIFLTNKADKRFAGESDLFYYYTTPAELKFLIDKFDKNTKHKAMIIFHTNLEELYSVFTSFFTVVNAAGGYVKNKIGDVLIINRLGKWDLPKGKVEEGEPIEQAALREVNEECGISNMVLVKPMARTYHTYHQNSSLHLKVTHWYEMYYDGNEVLTPQREEKIEKAIWIKPTEIYKLMDNTYLSLKDVFLTKN